MTHEDIAQHWPDVSFTPTEEKVLSYLARRGGDPATEADLLREVWGYAPSARSRTVATTIRRLRRKIETDPRRPRQLLFLRGQGYCLVPPEASAVTRAEVERRLREWLGPDQDWVTLVAPAPGQRGHLPAAAGPMVGRLDALDALTRLVRGGARLVTVHGAAGLGKTTLALALGRSLRDQFAGGVWFCALEAASNAEDLLDVVAASVGITGAPGADRPRSDGLVQALVHLGPTLLVLDNFEQLAPDAATAVADLLASAPDLQVVVTSRRVLGLPAEVAHPIAPLDLDEGVTLLQHCLERAGLPPEDPARLRPIVELVEGVPLAIEMAGARARLLSLTELEARLREDLGVLAHPAGPRPDRQKTLEAAIAWSWRLLGEPEREALAALCVFRGGFSLAAGERILDRDDSLDRLASLVDHSMIRRVEGGRLALFESVRQVVGRWAPLSPAVRERHAAWALEHACREISGGRVARVRALDAEVDNLVAAHEWLVRTADPRAIPLLDALIPLNGSRTSVSGMVERVRRTRAAVDADPAQAATLNAILAIALCTERAIDEADLEVQRGLERVAEGSRDHVRLLNTAAWIANQRGDTEAGLAHARAGVARAERLGSTEHVGHGKSLIGALLLQLGCSVEAERAFSDVAALAREEGALAEEAQAEANRASCLLHRGRAAEATALLEKARDLARKAHDPSVRYQADLALAVAYLLNKRFAEADELYRGILDEYPLHGASNVAGVLHLNAGLTALHLDESSRAVRLLARARREVAQTGRTDATPVMVEAYLAVALAETGQGSEAMAIWDQVVPPEQDPLWPNGPAEFALCLAHRHLVAWRTDGDETRLDAARALLAQRGPECPDSAAAAVLRRALERESGG